MIEEWSIVDIVFLFLTAGKKYVYKKIINWHKSIVICENTES